MYLRFILALISFFILTPLQADCGKMVSAVIKFDSEMNEAILVKLFKSTEEFCDQGKNEYNANFNVSLLDSNKKLIEEKNIFMNKFTIYEELNKSDPSNFEKSKVLVKTQYKNIKFSINGDLNRLKYYKIISLKDSRVLGSGEI